MTLLHPGPYGYAENDPKVILVRDLGTIVRDAGIDVVIIGGVAVNVNGHARQTQDVDLLVPRDQAVPLLRLLEKSKGFSKIRIDRFRHNATGTGVDLCVEGELTSPRHIDRFPSPASVERIALDPLPVAGLIDLLALKAKSARAQDEADFVRLFQERGLSAADVARVRAKIEDPKLRENLERWHARALDEIEREKLRRPPALE